ncbi:hypothetical protein AMS62_02570 [Bacillus sp. FJAT-18019]|nr:hypothetical protein AMS62_02570 [Bacillus sp. FJAT-18019]
MIHLFGYNSDIKTEIKRDDEDQSFHFRSCREPVSGENRLTIGRNSPRSNGVNPAVGGLYFRQIRPMKHRRFIRDKDAKGVKGKACLWLTRVVPRESNLSSLAISAMDDEVFLFFWA